MLNIERWVGPSPEQWDIIIEGMRNAKNSWDRKDSFICSENDGSIDICINKCHYHSVLCPVEDEYTDLFILGKNDHTLASNLELAGSDHRKFMRMLPVIVNVVAPLYWWKEFDTYKVGTVSNSCSTMHKIAAKSFEKADFSCDHLSDTCEWGEIVPQTTLDIIIQSLNQNRVYFIETGDKKYWWQMIQLLPSSYNQKRTISLNYEVLHNIYHARRHHKLDEWHKFCDWIETLPYSELITSRDLKDSEENDE